MVYSINNGYMYMYMILLDTNITIYGSHVTCNYILPYMVTHVM